MSEFDYRQYLLDLLAVIHRDGGQYTAEHGVDKSCADAEKIVAYAIQKQALTDEQIVDMWEFPRDLSWMDSVVKLVRKVEAVHGIS